MSSAALLCDTGALLDYLVHFKQVDGRGIEISQAGVNASVSQGLSVIQGDADTDLKDYPSEAFDYVVLSQTLQATRDPKGVLVHTSGKYQIDWADLPRDVHVILRGD